MDAFRSALKYAKKDFVTQYTFTATQDWSPHSFFHQALYAEAYVTSWHLEEKHINIFTGSIWLARQQL
ncbi:MAG: hypothetical protein ACLVEJ_05710 [Parabacteroides sp.]